MYSKIFRNWGRLGGRINEKCVRNQAKKEEVPLTLVVVKTYIGIIIIVCITGLSINSLAIKIMQTPNTVNSVLLKGGDSAPPPRKKDLAMSGDAFGCHN